MLALVMLGVLLASGGGTTPAFAEGSTPTLDPARLAQPTLPPSPAQADRGAQTYWLYCMPCHGDRGQGLTVEFRAVYPPEDRDCWTAGCHGRRPYQNGFTLPAFVPPLVGDAGLAKFANGAGLNAYIRAAMPFQAPGTLDEDTHWGVTAFILRENGVEWGEGDLGPSNAQDAVLAPPGALRPAPTSSLMPTALATAVPAVTTSAVAQGERSPWIYLGGAAVAGLALGVVAWLTTRELRRGQ